MFCTQPILGSISRPAYGLLVWVRSATELRARNKSWLLPRFTSSPSPQQTHCKKQDGQKIYKKALRCLSYIQIQNTNEIQIQIKIQMKRTSRYYLIPVRMSDITKNKNNHYWGGGCGNNKILKKSGGNANLSSLFFKKNNIKISKHRNYGPAISLLVIYPKDQTLLRKGICPLMFNAASTLYNSLNLETT